MLPPTRSSWRLTAVVLLALAAGAAAQTPAEQLEQAIADFQAGQYESAQQTLLAIDPALLNEEQRAQRDRYLEEVRIALNQAARARQEYAAAQRALEEGDLASAELLLRSVVKNRYAPQNVLVAAQRDLDRLAEKQQLEEALEAEQPPAEPRPITQPAPAEPPAQPVPLETRDQQAMQWVERGNEALDRGQIEQAQEAFSKALELVPGLPEAVAGLERVQQHRMLASGELSLVDRIRLRRALRWQRTEATFRMLERRITEAVARHDFDEAHRQALLARQVVEAGQADAPSPQRYAALLGQVAAVEQFIADAEERWHLEEVRQKREEIQRQARLRREQIEKARRQQIESLMDQAMQLRRQQRFAEAIDALRQVELIDPTYERARLLREDLEVVVDLLAQKDLQYEHRREFARAMHWVHEAAVPYTDEFPRYPKNWPEITARRTVFGLSSFEESPQTQALRDKLQSSLPQVQLQGVGFAEALDRLNREHGLNLNVRWNRIEPAGIDPKTPVDVSLQNISLARALDILLEQVAPPETPLAYTVSDGVVTISTQDDLNRDTVTRVYDISDLLVAPTNPGRAPNVTLTEARSNTGFVSTMPGDGSLFADETQAADSADVYENERRKTVERLLDLIRTTVQPGTWLADGGTVGAIRELNGQIIVTHTSQAHEQLLSLFDQLREQRRLQIAVEARLLTIRSNFLDEIGVDLDIVLNAGNAGFDQAIGLDPQNVPAPLTDPATGAQVLIPRDFSRLGFLPGVPPFGNTLPLTQAQTVLQPFRNPGLVPGRSSQVLPSSRFTPISLANNILSLTDPTGINTNVPGSFGGTPIAPAFQIFGSFLDNIQVDFLIRATQADSRATFLEAPRLVFTNGEHSWTTVATQLAYISGLQPIVAQEVGLFSPIVSTLTVGSVLDVTGVVSADRRYVTLDLEIGRALLVDLVNLQQQQAGISSRGVSAVVQLPRIQLSLIRTTVTIPDGGTLMIGGLKQTGEQRVEAGVPVLSKIPILKRFYDSRAEVRDEQLFIVLIRPTIIIQEEVEEDQFPGFASS